MRFCRMIRLLFAKLKEGEIHVLDKVSNYKKLPKIFIVKIL